MSDHQRSPRNTKKKISKSKVGVLWLAPVLLLCLTVLVFTIALEPYFEVAMSTLKVFLVDPVNYSQEKVEGGEYPVFGEEFATIQIESLDLLYPVYQGDTPENLSLGICHYYGSKFPGDTNNVVFDGHRTTHFANLGNMKAGDRVTVTTDWGTYIYEMVDSQIVDVAQEMDYTQRTPYEQLTLITCYPFTFFGSAPQRYIVRCKLVEGTPHEWGFDYV